MKPPVIALARAAQTFWFAQIQARATSSRVLLTLLLSLCGALGLATLSAVAQPTLPSPATHFVAVVTNLTVAPTFNILRYEVSGSSALGPSEITALMRQAVGTNVSLPQIRRALVRLQESYRERGFTKVTVTLPRQPLTDGVVQVRVVEGSDASTVTGTAPTYDLRHFEVRGNTALTPEQIDQIIGPLAGPAVTEKQIQVALADLQKAYRERGFPRAAVTVRQQVLLDGRVSIDVNEGQSAEPELAAQQAKTNTVAAKPPARTFEVRCYDVQGNALLSPETVAAVFTNAIGTNVTLTQIQKALGELQLAYRERGWATVSVGLPQQQLTNAVVRVQVTEGVLRDIRVTGNRHFSSNNVVRALPSLRTNTPLNSRVFQRELDIANQNRDRQVYPTLGPGAEPGESALTLRVQDRLPLHGRLDLNNYNTPGTPNWRINSSLQYNNLWQREHQVGVSYGFTPEAFKSDGLVPNYLFNQPLVANYGGYYRMPLGSVASVQDQIGASVGQFGYDEATRQYRLPPAGTRPDLTIYASGSSSDTGVKFGPSVLVTETPLLTIVSQDSGQNLTINNGVGGRFNYPLTLSDNRRLNFSAGLDGKYYSLESFNTNNFYITTVVTNSQGSQTIHSVVASPQPTFDQSVTYLPLSVGVDYSQNDSGGSLTASLGLSGNFVGSEAAFAALALSPDASRDYGKATLAVTREQRVFNDWSLLLRSNGQAATGPLINNEQFALGGINSVRGYFEGDLYGDAGWFGSVELRTPYLATEVPIWSGYVPTWLRASAFLDGGQVFLLDPPPRVGSRASLLGVGFGVSANINNHLDARISVGWPLRNTYNTEAYEPRVYFSLGGQF